MIGSIPAKSRPKACSMAMVSWTASGCDGLAMVEPILARPCPTRGPARNLTPVINGPRRRWLRSRRSKAGKRIPSVLGLTSDTGWLADHLPPATSRPLRRAAMSTRSTETPPTEPAPASNGNQSTEARAAASKAIGDGYRVLDRIGSDRGRNLSILAGVLALFAVWAIAKHGLQLFTQRTIDGLNNGFIYAAMAL